ncbi:MAG: SCO family protein, partial [Verrucomicrobiota bacterium]|nr:SCO family protein [Verrucomicrobiota bacterium]
MKTFFAIAHLLLAASSALAAANNSLTDDQLLQIKFDQKIGAQVSLDLRFLDEGGKQVQLGDYFGKKPVVLMLGYFECPMLCTLVLNGAVDGFQGLKWTVGEDFDVVFVSIDPKETPELAAGKRKTYFRSYGRGKEDGWHFLSPVAASRQSAAILAGTVEFNARPHPGPLPRGEGESSTVIEKFAPRFQFPSFLWLEKKNKP